MLSVPTCSTWTKCTIFNQSPFPIAQQQKEKRDWVETLRCENRYASQSHCKWTKDTPESPTFCLQQPQLAASILLYLKWPIPESLFLGWKVTTEPNRISIVTWHLVFAFINALWPLYNLWCRDSKTFQCRHIVQLRCTSPIESLSFLVLLVFPSDIILGPSRSWSHHIKHDAYSTIIPGGSSAGGHDGHMAMLLGGKTLLIAPVVLLCNQCTFFSVLDLRLSRH